MFFTYFVFDALCVAGLLVASYKSYKAVKDEGTRKKSQIMLQFWIMFALLQFISGFVGAYSRELKAVLVLMAFVPGQGRVILPAVYAHTAAPMFRKWGGPVSRRVAWLRRRVVCLLSQVHRAASSAALEATLPATTLAELASTESDLQGCLELLNRESRRRRTRQLKRSRRRLSAHPGKVDEMRPGAHGEEEEAVDGKVRRTHRASLHSTSSDDVNLDDLHDTASEYEDGGKSGGRSDSDGAGRDSESDDLFDEQDSWVQVPRAAGDNPSSFTPAPALRRRRLQPRYSTGGMR